MTPNPLLQPIQEAAGELRKAAEALLSETKVATATSNPVEALLLEKQASIYRNLRYLHLARQLS